ncbi:hypothetical protein CRV24_002762 [Beauveria bassiana]|nr:hypothetical protein CRV24_002762 [Beauveria bassiana]
MYLLTPPPPPPLLEPTGPLSRALTTRTLLDHVVTQVPTIAMSCHLPSTLSDRGDASTDFEITVGNVKYLLTESQKVNNFLLLVIHLALCSQLSSSDGHIMLFE